MPGPPAKSPPPGEIGQTIPPLPKVRRSAIDFWMEPFVPCSLELCQPAPARSNNLRTRLCERTRENPFSALLTPGLIRKDDLLTKNLIKFTQRFNDLFRQRARVATAPIIEMTRLSRQQ